MAHSLVEHSFGGDWTQEKLERVRKYLAAYVQIMKGKPYSYTYIDAFAGTGYINKREKDNITDEESQLVLPELVEPEVRNFIEGSVRTALRVDPGFKKYIFIEKDREKVSQLKSIENDFPAHAGNIEIICGDANKAVLEICDRSWRHSRAVIFLDPYGMQIPWSTIEKIASTKAIDLWYLFPIGVAINRLLKKNGDISNSVRNRLDQTFGEPDWFEAFYKVSQSDDLFGNADILREKTADFETIKGYFIERLESIFPGVAENPLWLTNSKNAPLYLLCFACSNIYAADTAKKIAQDILNPPKPKKKPNQLSLRLGL